MKQTVWLLAILAIIITKPTTNLTAQCTGTQRIDARYELENNDICEGETLTMLNVSEEFGNTHAFYIWDWGDGIKDTVDELRSVTHLYNFPDIDICSTNSGQKKVEVRLDAIVPNCEDYEHFVLKPIFIKLKPRASIESEDELCAPDLTLELEGNSCSAYEDPSYSWNFGDPNSGSQNTSTLQNPSHTFSAAGVYTVSLIVSDACGTAATAKEIIVYEEPLADVGVQLNPTTACLPVTATLTNQSKNITNWKWKISPKNGWDWADTIYNENTWDIQVRFFSPGMYDIELEAENPCEEVTWEQSIEILERPTVNLTSLGTYCEEATIDFCDYATFSGTIKGYDWTVTDPTGNITSFDTECPPATTFTTPGMYNVQVEVDGASCGKLPATNSFFITSPDGVQFESPIDVICTNSPAFQLIATPPNGTWSGSAAVNSNGLFSPDKANSGTVTLTYKPNGCADPKDLSLEILAAPTVQLSTVSTACEPYDLVPESSIQGTYETIEWTYTKPDGSTSNFSQVEPPILAVNQSGTHQLSLSAIGVCDNSRDSIAFDLIRLDAIDIPALPSPICNTSSELILRATPAGGTWTGEGIVKDSIFDPAALSPETYTLIYTYGDEAGICQAEKSVAIEVLAAIPIAIEADPLVCVEATAYTLTFDPTGGTWSGMGIIDSLAGIFNPQVTGTGTQELTYTYADEQGCSIVKTTTMMIEDIPTITSKPDTLSFCDTPENIDLQQSAALKLSPTTGTLTWDGLGIVDKTKGIFNSQQAGANGLGIYTIYINYQLTDCAIQDSFFVKVETIQMADAGLDERVCKGNEAVFVLNGTPASGQWQGTQIDAMTGEIDLDNIEAGIYNYTYVFSAGTSCEVSDEVTIEIIDLSNVHAGTNVQKCEQEEIFRLSGFSPAGGLWSGEGIVDAASGEVNPSLLSPGEYELSYCLSDAAIDCAACDKITLTINPLPISQFVINGTTCKGVSLDIENLSTNACSYLWDFGNGNTSTERTPIFSYSNIGNYTIQLTVTSCENCIDIFTYDISVTEPPSVAFEKDKKEGCADLALQFTNQSTGTDITYLWDFGNGDSSTIQQPTPILYTQGNTDKTYTITLAGTNACGTLIKQDSIVVFPKPIVNFGPKYDEGCSPLDLAFANASLGNPEQFEWYRNDVLIDMDSLIPDQIFTTSDTAISHYDITLLARNKCGSDTMTRTITVFPPNVKAFFHIDTVKGCQPLTVQLNNLATPGATIAWDLGDGNTSNAINPTHTFDSAGVFTIYQFASNCGTAVDSVTVEVLPAPKVQFAAAPFTCLNQALTLTNQSENIKGHIWHFSNGDSSALYEPMPIFDSIGEHTITLTGFSSANNCPATAQQSISVKGKPSINFTPSTFNGCTPLKVAFENTSEAGLTFEWDFGDQQNATVSNPTHTFRQAGTYEVRLMGTDSYGCFSDSSIVNIIAHEVPTSNFASDRTSYCSRVDTIKTQNLTIGNHQYYWHFGLGDTSTLFEPSQIYQDTGQYTISLIAENQFQCRDTSQQSIQILGTPLAYLPQAAHKGCQSFPISFNNLSQYADQFRWDFGDNNSSTQHSPNHTYLESGIYANILIAQNSNGCPADTFQTSIEVYKRPQSAFELSDSLTCGTPVNIMTNNQSKDAMDYQWDFGNGETSTRKSPIINYTSPATYTIQLIATNALGCIDTSYQQVSINEQPMAFFEPMYEQNCENDPINFSNLSKDATGWQWDLGDGTTSIEESPIHRYANANTYNIQLIADYQQVCFDTFSLPTKLPILTSPAAAFDWIDRNKGLLDFINLSQNGKSYLWDFGDGQTSTAFEPSHELEDNGTYEIVLLTTHANGCQQQYSEQIQPTVFFGMYFPNAFSPASGDASVRVFRPAGKGIADYTLQIFSAWGEQVWASSALEGESPAAAWDGYYKGALLPQGAYVWKANIRYINGHEEVQTGTVTLIR